MRGCLGCRAAGRVHVEATPHPSLLRNDTFPRKGGRGRAVRRRRRVGRAFLMAAANADRSVIAEEVARFDALGDDWWDPAGPMAPLHRLNPTRIAWLRDAIAAHFQPSGGGGEPPLAGLTLLDIGCGARPPRPSLCRGWAPTSPASIPRRARSRSPAPTPRRPAPGRAIASGRWRTSRGRARTSTSCWRWRSSSTSPTSPPSSPRAASLVKPGGLFAALDAQPHPEELRAGDRRRRIRPALARPRHPPLGAVRDARRTRRRPARGGAGGDAAARG